MRRQVDDRRTMADDARAGPVRDATGRPCSPGGCRGHARRTTGRDRLCRATAWRGQPLVRELRVLRPGRARQGISSARTALPAERQHGPAHDPPGRSPGIRSRPAGGLRRPQDPLLLSPRRLGLFSPVYDSRGWDGLAGTDHRPLRRHRTHVAAGWPDDDGG